MEDIPKMEKCWNKIDIIFFKKLYLEKCIFDFFSNKKLAGLQKINIP